MGIRLIVEFMDYGPTLTPMEWRAMVVLLEDANDGTRLTWSRVTDPKIEHRVGLSGKAWTNLRAALVRKGALIITVRAKRGQAAKYRIPIFDPNRMGHEIDDLTGEMGHEIDDLTRPIGHETDDANAQWVMRSIPPTPPNSSTTSPSTAASSSSAAEGPTPQGGGGGLQEQEQQRRDAAAVSFLEALPAPWTAGRKTARALAPLLLERATAQGWQPDADLVAQLTANPDGVRDYCAVLRSRIDDLPKRPTAKAATTAAPKCDQCDEAGFRYRDPENQAGPYRCPCRLPNAA